MKLSKKMRDFIRHNYRDWKAWVYDLGANHFFLFCGIHSNLMYRSVDYMCQKKMSRKRVCDYPGCNQKATIEFYPNFELDMERNETTKKKK